MPLVVAALRTCTAPPPLERASAATVRDGVGVNLHLGYGGTPYASPSRVWAALAYLRIVHVRDAALRNGPEAEARYAALAKLGARFDLFVSADPETQLRAVRRLTSESPGSVVSLEGPNEADHEPYAGGAPGDRPALRAYQDRIYVAVHGDPMLRSLPVLNFTTWPPLAGRADASNFHAYPTPARPLTRQLDWLRGLNAAVLRRDAPIVCTEAGFATSGGSDPDERRQAELVAILLLENLRSRVARTYLYELFDEHPDKAGSPPDRENHWGLFRQDGSAKPAADAIRRLMQLLAPQAPPGRPAAWPAVTARDLERLQVQREDGARLTFIWRSEPSRGRIEDVRVSGVSSADARWTDLATGRGGALGPRGTLIALGGAPIVLIQPSLAGRVARSPGRSKLV